MAAAVFAALITGVLNLLVRRQDIQARDRERQDEYREWYKRTLFDRRLAAINDGTAYLYRLNEMWNTPEGAEAAFRREAITWWRENALYLHDELPRGSVLLGAFNSVTQEQFFELLTPAGEFLRRRARQLGLNKLVEVDPEGEWEEAPST